MHSAGHIFIFISIYVFIYISELITFRETQLFKLVTFLYPAFWIHGWYMLTGKFRHLLVVENGEVLGLLDIAKCLHDAIARMKRAAEKGKAIAAAVEGVEKHWGTWGSAL